MSGRPPAIVLLAWVSLAAWLLLTRGLFPGLMPPSGATGPR